LDKSKCSECQSPKKNKRNLNIIYLGICSEKLAAVAQNYEEESIIQYNDKDVANLILELLHLE